jgi:hypothetical protein
LYALPDKESIQTKIQETTDFAPRAITPSGGDRKLDAAKKSTDVKKS